MSMSQRPTSRSDTAGEVNTCATFHFVVLLLKKKKRHPSEFGKLHDKALVDRKCASAETLPHNASANVAAVRLHVVL